jgi:hypothetical protein
MSACNGLGVAASGPVFAYPSPRQRLNYLRTTHIITDAYARGLG